MQKQTVIFKKTYVIYGIVFEEDYIDHYIWDNTGAEFYF